LEKRGRIYRSGLVAKGTPQAHRFPRHPAEMSFCRTLATYKERPLLSAPRTDPYVQLARIRLPPSMFDGEPIFWPRMKDSGFGQPVVRDFPCPFQRGFVSLATLFKRMPPEFDHTASEHHEGQNICWHRVIGKEASDHLLQPLALLGYGVVSSPAQFLPDLFELCSHTVTPGLPFKLEDSPARFAADERKAQKGEGLRLAEATLLAVVHRIATELNQAGLLRVKRQRKLLKPLPHHCKKPMCIGLALETDHQIIRVARYDHGARGFAPTSKTPN